MTYRQMQTKVILGVFVFALTLTIGLVLLITYSLIFTSLILFIVSITQVIFLARLISRPKQEISDIIKSIENSDLSFAQRHNGDAVQWLLGDESNQVLQQLAGEQVVAERQSHFLRAILQHIGIGIVIFDDRGKINLINNSARRILHSNRYYTLEDMRESCCDLLEYVQQLKPGFRKMISLTIDGDSHQIALDASQINLGERTHTLVSMQDVSFEMEDNEIESWQKLMRVLTHEIKNSISPISSLAATAEELMSSDAKEDEKSYSDAQIAIGTIHKRSSGLLKFIDDFSSLQRLPNPEFQIVPVKEAILRLREFFKQRFGDLNIESIFDVNPETLEVTADPNLIEQALINLVNNAIEAMENRENKIVKITSRLNREGRVSIIVEDNGPGIAKEALERIFIPFYSTKKNGSGVGLSICRQIMRVHKGNIRVRSDAEVGTSFSLVF